MEEDEDVGFRCLFGSTTVDPDTSRTHDLSKGESLLTPMHSANHTDVPEASTDVPKTNTDVPEVSAKVCDVPEASADVPKTIADVLDVIDKVREISESRPELQMTNFSVPEASAEVCDVPKACLDVNDVPETNHDVTEPIYDGPEVENIQVQNIDNPINSVLSGDVQERLPAKPEVSARLRHHGKGKIMSQTHPRTCPWWIRCSHIAALSSGKPKLQTQRL